MSDHLPECSESMIPDFHNERWICICAPLRACEQRVLDAAREAVAAMPLEDRHGGLTAPEVRAAALAAIDALREEKK